MEPTGVGVHVKTRDRVSVLDAVRAAMEAEGLEWVGGGMDAPADAVRMLLLPPRGNWTSLYPERADLARELAALVTLQLQTPALVVGRLEEAAFFYDYYDAQGNLADEYHSCPDWAKDVDEDDASDDEIARTKGNAQVLAPLLSATSAEALQALLDDSRIERLRDHNAYEGPQDNAGPLTQLAEALALPDLLEDFDELWHLGLDDEDEVDLRYLAYGEATERVTLRGLAEKLRARFRRAPKEESAEPAPKEEPEAKPDGDAKAKPPGGPDVRGMAPETQVD